MSDDFPSYWLESSLKISAVEQVELLEKFRTNRYGCTPENIVPSKIPFGFPLPATEPSMEKPAPDRLTAKISTAGLSDLLKNRTVPATCCQYPGTSGAAGSKAAEIARSVLSELHLL